MLTVPVNNQAYNLFQDGIIAFGQMERNGMQIDIPYCKRQVKKLNKKMTIIEDGLQDYKEIKLWKKIYGANYNLDSDQQLANILFNKLKYDSFKKTDSGQDSVDQEALEQLNKPFVKEYLERKKTDKIIAVLEEIIRETTGGVLRGVFNLHTVVSYRSSSSKPNLQNKAKRDKKAKRIVRKAFRPRPGHQLMELDLKGAEVGIATCVTGDTVIETIDGPQTIKRVIRRLKKEKVYTYGYDRKKKRIAISQVTDGGITKKKAEVWCVTLDNGETIKATPDHKFLLRSGKYIKLRNLKNGDSLMPFYKKIHKPTNVRPNYERIYLNNGKNILAHNLIALDIHDTEIKGSSGLLVHHIDGNGCNNSLDNLEIMSRKKHMRIHSLQSWQNYPKGKRDTTYHNSKENKQRLRELNKKRKEEWAEKDWEEFGHRVSEGLKRSGGSGGKRNNMYGKKHTEKTKRKISQSKSGVKTNLTPWNKGLTKHNNETIRKIANAKIGKPAWNKGKSGIYVLSEKTKKLISEKMKGRVFSEETKKKLSANKKAYWEGRKGEKVTCAICQKQFTVITNTHLKKHGITPQEYRETHNHKVTSVEFCGYEDVYNLNVDGIHNYAVGAGVVIKNCYHKDPNMISYIKDDTKDMHRDMAMQSYILKQNQVTKMIRYTGKNMFVFPQFYGDYYANNASAMWNWMTSEDQYTADDVELLSHLYDQGITCYDDFEAHMKKVENHFWKKRFAAYGQWKEDWYGAYLENGYFDSLTGFRYSGKIDKNQVINYPVQGSAFHCLLWALIKIQKIATRNRWKTKIVNQIHDAIVFDVHPSELEMVIRTCKAVITEELLEAWKWIIVPIEIEIELGEVDGTWNKMKEISV